MTLPNAPFGSQTNPSMGSLDNQANALGAMAVTFCTAGGSANAITLTPIAGQVDTTSASYVTGVIYGFVPAATNSATTTAQVGSLAPLNVYRNTTTGPALLAGNEIAINNYHFLVFDSALNGGLGGFHLANPAIPAAATLKTPTTQVFLSGSGTYTPPGGVLYLRVWMVGGGGGGGGVGTSGAGQGSVGGNSTFSTFTAGGGGGGGLGSPSNVGTGGIGGVATGSPNIGVTGTGGGSAININAGQPGGQGGSSFFGGAGRAITAPLVSPATNSGTGGNGATGSAAVFGGGGGGSGAFCYLIITTPAAVSYAVGAGGAGGIAGVGGNSGVNGAAGLLYVEELYQ